MIEITQGFIKLSVLRNLTSPQGNRGAFPRPIWIKGSEITAIEPMDASEGGCCISWRLQTLQVQESVADVLEGIKQSYTQAARR